MPSRSIFSENLKKRTKNIWYQSKIYCHSYIIYIVCSHFKYLPSENCNFLRNKQTRKLHFIPSEAFREEVAEMLIFMLLWTLYFSFLNHIFQLFYFHFFLCVIFIFDLILYFISIAQCNMYSKINWQHTVAGVVEKWKT